MATRSKLPHWQHAVGDHPMALKNLKESDELAMGIYFREQIESTIEAARKAEKKASKTSPTADPKVKGKKGKGKAASTQTQGAGTSKATPPAPKGTGASNTKIFTNDFSAYLGYNPSYDEVMAWMTTFISLKTAELGVSGIYICRLPYNISYSDCIISHWYSTPMATITRRQRRPKAWRQRLSLNFQS
jgi:hypothetical protein